VAANSFTSALSFLGFGSKSDICKSLFDNEIGDYQGDQDRIEVYQGGFETFDPPPP